MNGVLNVHGVNGSRTEPLSTFFKGPGKNALQQGDIVTSISFPIPQKGHAGSYTKLGRNKLSDLSIVGITVYGFPDPAAKSGFRIRLALASVAPIPMVITKVEEILASKSIDENSIQEAAQAAMDACTPIDDVRGSARYRKYMVRNLSKRTLLNVWDKLK
jgi:CO/xanthine dehydrogenase FAD-binding subunit